MAFKDKLFSLLVVLISLQYIKLIDPSENLKSDYINCELKVLKVNYESEDKINKGVLLFDTNTKLTLNTNESIRTLYFDWVSEKLKKIDFDNLDFIKKNSNPTGGYVFIVDHPNSNSRVKWTLPLVTLKKLKNYYRKEGVGDVYFIEVEIVAQDNSKQMVYIRFIVDEKNINCDKDILKERLMAVFDK